MWMALWIIFSPVRVPMSPQPASQAASQEADDDDDSDNETDEAEAESVQASSAPADNTLHFSADISDAELEKRFVHDIASLGSISVGFADSGRLINGVRVPDDIGCAIVVPEYAWGTKEAVDGIIAINHAMRQQFPDAAPMRINHIGKKEGGYINSHKSHQSGRDVDIGFYYKGGVGPGGMRGDRMRYMDLAPNWALVKAVAMLTDTQFILVDKKVQRVLYDYALQQGEDRAWLDTMFFNGHGGFVQHAKHHRDHFHVRFFAPRSQELGRRVQPMLAKRPDENRIIYRVHSGDNLGRIAKKYGSSVAMIQKANGMHNTFLKLGRALQVPMRGACTQCPMPPPVVLPPRHLPPVTAALASPAPVKVVAAPKPASDEPVLPMLRRIDAFPILH
jgi:murein endopeptidase